MDVTVPEDEARSAPAGRPAPAAGPRTRGPAARRPGTDRPTPDPLTADPLGLGVPGTPGMEREDLPEGVGGAEERGSVICFNAAAARIPALRPRDVLGRSVERALPLEDLEGRRWWQLTDPYGGLAIRVGQPERNL